MSNKDIVKAPKEYHRAESPAVLKAIQNFLRLETSGGILLGLGAILAMILANSPLAHLYFDFQNIPVQFSIGAFKIAKPLLLWVNDGLMAIFFLLVGLELKREIYDGELSNPSQVVLPLVAAVGGMLVPALIYVYFNIDNPETIRGWAIPAATDIAFSLGILSLLGSRVPIGLKIFLVTLAIFDDMGAIIIIAIFYSHGLSLGAIVSAIVCMIFLFALNRRRVTNLAPYLLIGIVLWVSVLKSGVHATLAGVVLAFFIPYQVKNGWRVVQPTRRLEHSLHSTVAYGILPLFAFLNAGLQLSGLSIADFNHGITLGVGLGLFLGKPIGIMGFSVALILLGWAKLPRGGNWLTFFATSILCGVGFTMSLFIASLAFNTPELAHDLNISRLGVLGGSMLSALVGYIILAVVLPKTEKSTSVVRAASH